MLDLTRFPRLLRSTVLGAALLCLLACNGHSGSNSVASGGGGSTPPPPSGPVDHNTFWLALESPTDAAGTAGLFALPGNNLTATPTLIGTHTGANYILFTDGYTVSANYQTVATQFYAAIGTDGRGHLYGLQYTDLSQVPAPAQISSFSVASLSSICDYSGETYGNVLQDNYTDPTTLFVVLHVAGPNGCGTSQDTYQVVHFKDSATQTPSVVALNSAQLSPLYQPSGALAGLISYDPIAGNINFYPNEAFVPTSRVTLVSGATGFVQSAVAPLPTAGAVYSGNTGLYLTVTANSNTQALYYVSNVGTASEIYPFVTALQGPLNVVLDTHSVYFTDLNSSGTAESILQTPVNTATPAVALSSAANLQAYLLGSNDQVLTFEAPHAGVAGSLDLYSLTVGANTVTASNAGPFAGNPTWLLAAADANALSGLALFESSTPISANSVTWQDEVLSATGTVLAPTAAQSAFVGESYGAPDYVFTVTGITDTNGGMGGGAVAAVNVGTLASTPLNTPDGLAYTVPAGHTLYLSGASDTIGAGNLYPVAGGAPTTLVYDIPKQLLVPVTFPPASP